MSLRTGLNDLELGFNKQGILCFLFAVVGGYINTMKTTFFYKALIPYKHISNYKLTSYDEDGIKEFSLFILKLLI